MQYASSAAAKSKMVLKNNYILFLEESIANHASRSEKLLLLVQEAEGKKEKKEKKEKKNLMQERTQDSRENPKYAREKNTKEATLHDIKKLFEGMESWKQAIRKSAWAERSAVTIVATTNSDHLFTTIHMERIQSGLFEYRDITNSENPILRELSAVKTKQSQFVFIVDLLSMTARARSKVVSQLKNYLSACTNLVVLVPLVADRRFAIAKQLESLWSNPRVFAVASNRSKLSYAKTIETSNWAIVPNVRDKVVAALLFSVGLAGALARAAEPVADITAIRKFFGNQSGPIWLHSNFFDKKPRRAAAARAIPRNSSQQSLQEERSISRNTSDSSFDETLITTTRPIPKYSSQQQETRIIPDALRQPSLQASQSKATQKNVKVKNFAEELCISVEHLNNLIDKRLIPSVEKGGHVRIPFDEANQKLSELCQSSCSKRAFQTKFDFDDADLEHHFKDPECNDILFQVLDEIYIIDLDLD
eukprot:TRINITY_DN6138_c0_g1_i1.p1 TRINITY_DN6138_c0_g1~~TRINITY_DN6138_c0_g1_i1.p1  ORF type:complete len:537 (+),score=135.46 TRINITY_DN6138_c0_g1_i1:181-1611(+)